jgi:outer membrane protein
VLAAKGGGSASFDIGNQSVTNRAITFIDELETSVNRLINKLMGMLVLMLATTGVVQAADGGSGLKVAVLNMQEALFNSERAKAADEDMRRETQEDENKIRNLATEAQRLQERLQNDGSTMSAAEQRRANDDLEELAAQYQVLVQRLQNLVQQRQQEFQQALAPNLLQAIEAVVQEDNYDLVLRAEAAIHYRGAFDITARVTEKLNRQ